MIMSFGGLPLLYYGDELGTLNERAFLDDAAKASDNRWMHRPRIDWDKAALREHSGSVEQRIFSGLQKMITVRKQTPAFADYNNRELIDSGNEHLFVFQRNNPFPPYDTVLVIGNFDAAPQALDLGELNRRGQVLRGPWQDLYSGESPALFHDKLVVPPLRFYWLTPARH